MDNQIYKELVTLLGFYANIVEEARDFPSEDDYYKGFASAHRCVRDDLADLLLKAEPNTLEPTTYQNWDI